jgi:EAL domain-containing protein (putative c-di-GMP-specific phosphodiesterase class I)
MIQTNREEMAMQPKKMPGNTGSEEQDRMIGLLSASPCQMHFQPIIESGANGIFGFEALFRGFKGRPITNFRKVLAQQDCSRVLWELDLACLASALRQGSHLTKRHRLFINVHACTIGKLAGNKWVLFLFMQALGIDPASVVLELSEDTSFADMADYSEDIQELRNAGIHIAVDNVKTDVKWLQHVSGSAATYIKIDRLYIADIASGALGQFFVENICLLAKDQGLDVIAVGVEREDAGRILEGLGVSLMQGFHLGYPKNAEEWRSADAGTCQTQIAAEQTIIGYEY